MATTVGQLKAILAGEGISDEMIVVLSSDPEGNKIAELAADEDEQVWSHAIGFFDPEDGEFVTEPDPERAKDEEETERWAWFQEHGQAAICLWPER